MMRAANNGTLNITPLPPNPAPIPKNPGPLSDPQTDFFLNALGLNHIWTVPSGPILSGNRGDSGGVVLEVPIVEFSMDRNKSVDPNQLSISDDEVEKVVHNEKEIAVDANEINLDDDDDDEDANHGEEGDNHDNDHDNDDENDDVWAAASISASQVSFNASRTNTNTNTHALILPTAEARNNDSKKVLSDVISFDDDVQIVPNACDVNTVLKF
jgi:hypothetical protein